MHKFISLFLLAALSCGSAAFSFTGDYNGDGKTDMAIYDPTDKAWFVKDIQNNPIAFAEIWGVDNGIPVPGDYNGDGADDLAIYDTKNGTWFVKASGSGQLILFGQVWGDSTMIPVPGDYNGDGISDMAMYQTSTGFWFIRSLNGQLIAFAQPWGDSSMIPVSGDYNGDGISDMAVYQSSTGAWFIRSMNGTPLAFAEIWGVPNGVPAPGDYNGDGADDLAVYHPPTGTWYIKASGSGNLLAFGELWGDANKLPAPGDYNGDGIADLAVYDFPTAKWYIRTMNNVPLAFDNTWGINGKSVPPQTFLNGAARDLIVSPLEELIGTPGPGGGFIWKPRSESNGNLVVLLPKSLTDGLRFSMIVDEDGNVIEYGSFRTDTHNGNREHYFFSKPGANYGLNKFLVSKDRQGNLIHWAIPNGAARVDL